MSVWIRRASGLLVSFEPPELTLEAAIDRSWHLRSDGRLMEPKPEDFLPTTWAGRKALG